MEAPHDAVVLLERNRATRCCYLRKTPCDWLCGDDAAFVKLLWPLVYWLTRVVRVRERRLLNDCLSVNRHNMWSIVTVRCEQVRTSVRRPRQPSSLVHCRDQPVLSLRRRRLRRQIRPYTAFTCFASSALTLLVGWQEEHPARKNRVTWCWRGYAIGLVTCD